MKIGNSVDILSGFAFKSKCFNNEERGLPIIRIRDVTTNSVSTYYDGEYKEEYIISNGDLLVGMDGQFKLIEWEGGKALLNQRVCKIIPKSNHLDKSFVKYLLPKSLKEIEDKTSFVTVKHLSVKKIKEIELPMYKLSTQKRIAQILDDAAALRDKTAQLLKEYDALAQSIFLDMFGDPVVNPKGWEKVPMKDLMTIQRGGSPRPIKKFIGGKYPWIKIGDATKGDDIYLHSTKEKIIEEGLSKTRLLPSGSLIFANCGVSLGFARIIQFQGCIHDGWLAFSEFDETKINKIFILKTLNSITQYFRDTAPDGTQPNLNTTIMKSFLLIVPPIDLQISFENKIKIINEQKTLAKQELQESEDLFNCLLQKAFKGELV